MLLARKRASSRLITQLVTSLLGMGRLSSFFGVEVEAEQATSTVFERSML